MEPRSPAFDLGYLLAHELDTEIRRKNETRLLQLFLDCMESQNSMEEVTKQYRIGMVFVLLALSFILATYTVEAKGRAVVTAVTPRVVAAFKDHRMDMFVRDLIGEVAGTGKK
jgi:hypothetical protein